ncbi:hypothetical protein V5O48_019669, partial [Marasmius crinis-equi]
METDGLDGFEDPEVIQLGSSEKPSKTIREDPLVQMQRDARQFLDELMRLEGPGTVG